MRASKLAPEGILRLCLGLWILAAGGCVTDPPPVSSPAKPTPSTNADGSSEPNSMQCAPAFYPLTLGNRWEYEGSFRLQVFDEDGVVIETFSSTSQFIRELIDTEVLFDREYVVEKETGVYDSPFAEEPQTWVYWRNYRQDRSGLYEADVPLTQPPGVRTGALMARRVVRPSVAMSWSRIPESHLDAFRRALQRIETRRQRMHEMLGRRSNRPGGPLANEITLLRYPLHPGSTWKIRDDPDLVIHGVVEGHDLLDLPAGRFPAWRIRVIWDIPDFDDTIRVWYGSSGYLQWGAHFEDEATDSDGNPIGTVVSDETEVLESLHLVEGSHSHGPH